MSRISIAFERRDHNPHRIELKNVPGLTEVQIHVGNTAANVIGCFAVGTTRSKDFVGGSATAMKSILDIVHRDGSKKISVSVTP